MSLLKRFALDTSDTEGLAKALLRLEPTGVLSRDICYQAIPLDEEIGERVLIPPRLFLITEYLLLVHAYGDDAFYDLYPTYERGGLSKECHVLRDVPLHLSNYFAMQSMYREVGAIPAKIDTLSLAERRPKPMTSAERDEWLRERRRAIRKRDQRLLGLSVVKRGEVA